MEIYYFLTILIAILFVYNKKYAYYSIILLGVVFLILIPSTGNDYVAYKHAFDNAYFTTLFPWFQTASYLTSEPFYLWYTSFWSVILPLEFPYFLAFNFIICVSMVHIFFKPLFKEHTYYFWVMLLPVIFPTIFYWSPRSSISFILILGGFLLLVNKRYWKSGVLLFLGCMMHSQFLLISFLIISTYFILLLYKSRPDKYLQIIIVISFILFVFLISIDKLTGWLSSSLSFLPSGVIITSKLGYFEREAESSFRLTAVLSIAFYPVLAILLHLYKRKSNKMLFFNHHEKDFVFTIMLLAVCLYGAVINLAFWDNPHVAGRLSRFSDYIGMGILIPTFFRTATKQDIAKVVVIFFCVISPFLYKSLYVNASWGF